MPTYNYQCEKCGHAEEIFMSIKEMEKAQPVCQTVDCNFTPLTKVITATGGFQLKGTGFHSTDWPKK